MMTPETRLKRTQQFIGRMPKIQEGLTGSDFLVSCVAVANQLANHFRVGTAGDEFVNPSFLKIHSCVMGFSFETMMGLKSQMETEIEKARVYLQLA